MSATLAPGSDIVLELDGAGLILDVAFGASVASLDYSRTWVGRAWIETVAVDSRNAVMEMLAEVASSGNSRGGLITHVSPGGDPFPVVYTVMHRDQPGRLVARGFDLRGMALGRLGTLVGHVSLKTLVRDATGLVERHFIVAALELTDDNRTSAAEVLGLSRQGLYMKLRRYGLAGENGRKG